MYLTYCGKDFDTHLQIHGAASCCLLLIMSKTYTSDSASLLKPSVCFCFCFAKTEGEVGLRGH